MLSEEPTISASVTDHPIEIGANVSDHIRPNPDVLRMDVVVSNTPVNLPLSQPGSVPQEDIVFPETFSGSEEPSIAFVPEPPRRLGEPRITQEPRPSQRIGALVAGPGFDFELGVEIPGQKAVAAPAPLLVPSLREEMFVTRRFSNSLEPGAVFDRVGFVYDEFRRINKAGILVTITTGLIDYDNFVIQSVGHHSQFANCECADIPCASARGQSRGLRALRARRPGFTGARCPTRQSEPQFGRKSHPINQCGRTRDGARSRKPIHSFGDYQLMAIERIPVDPDYPDQTFRIVLDGTAYILRLLYMERPDRWHLFISDNDGNPIAGGIKVVIDEDLLKNARSPDAPPGIIVAAGRVNGQICDPSLGQLGREIPLFYLDAEEVAAL